MRSPRSLALLPVSPAIAKGSAGCCVPPSGLHCSPCVGTSPGGDSHQGQGVTAFARHVEPGSCSRSPCLCRSQEGAVSSLHPSPP